MSCRLIYLVPLTLLLTGVGLFDAGRASAQQPPVTVEIEVDDFEEEEDEEPKQDGQESEREEADEDEELGEIFEVKEVLEAKLGELREQAADTRRRIAAVDRYIILAKRASQLGLQIEAAERGGNDALANKLGVEFESVEKEMEVRREVMELDFELEEVSEELDEAEREEDFERSEILEVLREGLRRLHAIKNELLPIYLNGPAKAANRLEQESAKVYTNKVEKPHRALQVLEHLREAEEDEDFQRVEELERRLDRLRADMDGESPPKNRTDVTRADELQPILVTPETLAPYLNQDLHRDLAPLLRQFCFECHSNDSSSGELNIEKLLSESPIVRNRDMWVNVIEQTKNHVMPPEGETQPSLEQRRQLVLSLHNAIFNFDYGAISDPGFEAARRLTHREYSNTVRDLFGVELDVVDRFPDDLTATSGFDNSANSLFVQPLLMERYISIAEYVVNRVLPEVAETGEQKARLARLFGDHPPQTSAGVTARDVMTRFLVRAFRRPPHRDELDRYVRQIEAAVAAGSEFDAAVRAALQTVLISPSFLLRTEKVRDTQDAYRIDDWELASRLSYFIWASMPDDELFELAATGKLHDSAVLEQQVLRMLGDPKADTLGSIFAAQWLGSQYLGVRMRLDPIDNPWCTETLMAAMRDETAMFFNSLVRANRPITELIDADYTYLNEELARLYHIQGVEGQQMRRVKLANKQRGGIFGHGSLLAVTSFPGRTSPVVRGKWILDSVLGTPPPPPPPNVSELSEDLEDNGRLSFREKLELHRSKPNCYACHSQMDPLGFSLQQYDWFGRYRRRLGGKRIDSTGELPDGTKFKGLDGLKRVIVQQRHDDLVRQLSQKMLSYALGRQLEYYDELAIRNIAAKVSADGDRMQTLVREVVKSYPFQFRQNRRQQPREQ